VSVAVESLERRLLFVIPGTSLGIWHSYAQASSDLQTIHAAYPNLTQLISIGKTVQNRDIWAMRITDNPLVEENEPEFFYQGSMHGDEPVGMAMSMYFIQHLLENYAGDSRIAGIVNGTDVWTVPNLNWDGYSRPAGARRGNANNVDLNRNFPEWTTTKLSVDTIHLGDYGNVHDGPAPVTSGLQPETIAMMNWRASQRFVASASLHSGDLVVSYPWDTNGNLLADYATTPDDALYRQMALRYSLNNPPMAGSPFFPQGITNGDDWYPLSGGEGDWAHIYTGAIELTVELSTTKFPSAATLPTFWNNNRESMLSLVETVQWGVHGSITGALNGLPLEAKVTVTSPAPAPAPDSQHPSTRHVFTDTDTGDYHRMLLPGNYTLEYAAPGYVTQTISNVIVTPNQSTTLNVQLMPVDTTAPVVLSPVFDFDAPKPALKFGFSEDIASTLGAADLALVNLTTGQTIDSAGIALTYDAAGNVGTFSFTGLPGQVLPDGNYRATLAPGSIADAWGNALASSFSFDFFVLAGDADRDRSISVSDLGILASHWQQPAATFSQGDFDYSGVVDVGDLGILASRWQQGLPEPSQPIAPAGRSAARRADRIVDHVLA
jgi:hypothetical protein